MKKYLCVIISLILVFCFSSCNFSKIDKIPISQTEEHFDTYVEALYDYKDDLDSFWFYGRSGSILILYGRGSTSIDFSLYNQLPDELSLFQKNNAEDYGYEKYSLYTHREIENESELFNFDNKYGYIISILLSKVAGEEISTGDIVKALNKSGIDKNSSYFQKSCKETLHEKIIYDKTLYINHIWCNYKLTYYPNLSKSFREMIEIGGEFHNNFVNLHTYE